MNRILDFLSGLRGKLILTYTLVTVLALLVLEILVLVAVLLILNWTNLGNGQYFSDVVFTLYPRASQYLQPGAVDTARLQTWLDGVVASRHASSEPVTQLDSPAALFVADEPVYVIAPDGRILAQAPHTDPSRVGQTYVAPNPAAAAVLSRALAGELTGWRLATTTQQGNAWMAIPIRQGDINSPVVGAMILTVQSPPPFIVGALPWLFGIVLGTGILLLCAVAPIGALFGMVMSRGLTRRLTALTRAADAWSEGNFAVLPPPDRSRDEIGLLGRQMRHMAEQLQNLMRTRQEVAMLQERNRLARELHDTVKQQNFATLMQVRAARNRLPDDVTAAGENLAQAERLIKMSQQELGLMITELRPAALEGQGLASALQNYLAEWSRQLPLTAVFEVQGERKVSRASEQALFRVAQEALANVARHSAASRVDVRLSFAPDSVTLSVADNGTGFDPSSVTEGFGLTSMAERVNQLGGQLTVTSVPHAGTTITAKVPIADNEQ